PALRLRHDLLAHDEHAALERGALRRRGVVDQLREIVAGLHGGQARDRNQLDPLPGLRARYSLALGLRPSLGFTPLRGPTFARLRPAARRLRGLALRVRRLSVGLLAPHARHASSRERVRAPSVGCARIARASSERSTSIASEGSASSTSGAPALAAASRWRFALSRPKRAGITSGGQRSSAEVPPSRD